MVAKNQQKNNPGPKLGVVLTFIYSAAGASVDSGVASVAGASIAGASVPSAGVWLSSIRIILLFALNITQRVPLKALINRNAWANPST